MPELTQLEGAVRLAIAALIGLGVGLEREWSGHASGPDARFAGLRTFLLLGLLGGSSGILITLENPIAAAAIAAGAALLSVAAYVMAVRRTDASLDGTTEAAALVVVTLGLIAGIGWLALAAGAAAIVVLALREKSRMHWLVSQMEENELRAAFQFAVLALVVLPLLPVGPYLGDLAIRPRLLWSLVLVFSGLNFAGYIARRAIGPARGYSVAGALGGLVSSTGVTLTFSRQSRVEPDMAALLASGVVAASTVMFVRVNMVAAALAPVVAVELLPLLVAPAALGVLLLLLGWRTMGDNSNAAGDSTANPLRLWSAIKMALLFQAGMIAMALATIWVGEPGLYVTGALLGITDIDALTVSMTTGDARVAPAIAARVIAVGVVAVTLFKLVLSVVLGSPKYRRLTATGLLLMSLACGIAILLLRK